MKFGGKAKYSHVLPGSRKSESGIRRSISLRFLLLLLLLKCGLLPSDYSTQRAPQRKERHRFVRIAVRLTTGPLTSLVTWHGYGVSCWISADLRRR